MDDYCEEWEKWLDDLAEQERGSYEMRDAALERDVDRLMAEQHQEAA